MSVRNLDSLFRPTSVAVIGASNSPNSIGGVVMRNLLKGGFTGPIMPVNPKYPAVAGVLTYPDVAHLPLTPDVAVICTPPATIPGLIEQLGERGTRAAIVITAGLSNPLPDNRGRTIQQAMLDAVRRAFLPHRVLLFRPQGTGSAALTAIAPRAEEMKTGGGPATAYVCRNFACSRPVQTVDEMMGLLGVPVES